MTVVEHLDELRFRLVVAVVAFTVGAIVAYVFYRPVLDLITAPLDQDRRIGGVAIKDLPLYAQGVTGPFLLRVKVSAFAGLLLAMPVIVLQLWRFVTPGLEPREKRYAVPFLLSSTGLFALGAWFAFLVLPPGIGFLLSFAGPPLQPFITFQDYLRFLFFMVLAFGISFEFPLLLVFLSLAGVVDSQRLRGWRRYAIFLAFVVGAVATPSQDPYTQVVFSVPLYILYEASILVIRFGLKR